MDGGNGVGGMNIADDINPDGFFNDTNDTVILDFIRYLHCFYRMPVP